MRKIGWCAALAGALMLCLPAAAGAEEKKDEKFLPGGFSGYVGFISNYHFRGISQTDNGIAFQGALNWEMPISKDPDVKIFLGGWASNIDFTDARVEVDVYGGAKGTMGSFAWQFQIVGYLYPGAQSFQNFNYFELNPSAGYDFGFASVTGGLFWSPDYFAGSGNALYLYGDATVPIPAIEGLKELFDKVKPAIVLHIGRQWIQNNTLFGARDYTDWAVGFQFNIDQFTIAVKYIDNDLGQGDCFGGSRVCKAAAVVSVSFNF